MKLSFTRAMIGAALKGELDKAEFENACIRLAMPKTCPGVPNELLNPRNTWADKRVRCEDEHFSIIIRYKLRSVC